jgi:hypothetical protein
MTDERKAADVDRRGFLKRAGAVAGVVGAAAIAGGHEAVAATADPQTSKAGYRETEHVRTYYELAKF